MFVRAKITIRKAARFGLAAVLVVLVVKLYQRRREPLIAGTYALTIATFVALYGVALITQQQVLVWLLLGAAAGIPAARAAANADEPVDDELPADPLLAADQLPA